MYQSIVVVTIKSDLVEKLSNAHNVSVVFLCMYRVIVGVSSGSVLDKLE